MMAPWLKPAALPPAPSMVTDGGVRRCVKSPVTVAETVTGPVLTEAYGLPLRVERVGNRFTAQATGR